MKICVTAQGGTLDSAVDPRFGRCRYFIFVDTGDLEFEAVGNPNLESTGGAGIQSAQLAVSRKAEAVITGNIGPNAFQVLQAASAKRRSTNFSTSMSVPMPISLYIYRCMASRSSRTG